MDTICDCGGVSIDGICQVCGGTVEASVAGDVGTNAAPEEGVEPSVLWLWEEGEAGLEELPKPRGWRHWFDMSEVVDPSDA